METGRYLYGVVRSREERAFKGITPIGDAPGPVYTVSEGDLAVVVSDVQQSEFESTRANMLAHQRVLETVMREFPLLPVRFGTVAVGTSPVTRIRMLLGRRVQEFAGLFAEVEGRVELGLKALWRDERAVFHEIAGEFEAVRRLRDSIQGKPDHATRYERIRLGQLVKGALERKRETEAAALVAPLRPLADRLVQNPLLLDRMIVNAAFLVGAEREAEFDLAVNRLDEDVGRRIAIKYVGPVPPYNFVNVVVNWHEL